MTATAYATPPRYRLSLVREAEAEPGRPMTPAAARRWLWDRIYSDAAADQGGLVSCTAEPRGVIVPGLLINARSVIVAHNHPSGDPSPSLEDLDYTRRLAQACAVVGLHLHDHLIFGDAARSVSLKDGHPDAFKTATP